MSMEQAYNFPMPGFWSDRSVAEYVFNIDESRYLLRQLDAYMLYRVVKNNCVEHTLFVPYRQFKPLKNPQTAPLYSQKEFAEQISAGANGRVALYACPEARDCNPLLFFHQNGTAFFADYNTANGYSGHESAEEIKFAWNGNARGITNISDILEVPWPQLKALCHDVFTTQVWPRMSNPFVSYAELPDAPLVWKCGSQEELTHITHCIFHTEPDEWADLEARDGRTWQIENHCIPLAYAAEMLRRPGGPPKHGSERIRALCRLAFQHNTFTGYEWHYHRYANRKRQKCYKAKPLEVVCRIAPPSAHERAESMLTLWDWLKGKVSENRRRAYLGME